MSKGLWSFACSGVTLCMTMFMLFVYPFSSEAGKRTASFSPVKITEVVTSPDPFILGKSALTLAILVELPPSLHGANVLEVSAMITSPTRRSMSFLAHRRVVDDREAKGRSVTIPMVLVWDGKDQTRQLVPDGSYFYELQAKLMEDQGNGPRTKIISRRVHGTLEALAYPGEVLPPLPPEPDVPEELENLQNEDGAEEEEESPALEENLEESDDPEMPGEGHSHDVADHYPEEPGISGPLSGTGEPEENGEVSNSELPDVPAANP